MEYKQVIIVRKDLKMGCGKIAAQVAHGSIASMALSDNSYVKKWGDEGMRKIVLKTNSLDDLYALEEKLRENNITSVFVSDFGLTQIPNGSTTVLAIEIKKNDEIDKFISEFKLL